MESLGVEGSKALYLYNEKRDNTHTSVHGATVYAGLVRDELVARHLVPEGLVRVGWTPGASRPEPGRPRYLPVPPERDRKPDRFRSPAIPEDRTLSPYTGYTRAHWEAAADALLAAVEPYATEDRALYHLPGDHTSWSGRLSDGLEGYARTLLLAAFRRDEKALERYADGLAAGTAGVWPRIEDRSQPLVEAASIALALRLTRPLLWDRLDDGVRQRAAAWLGDALTAEPWPCNWELFPVTVGGFLAEIGVRARGRPAPRSTGAWSASSSGTSATAGTPTATAAPSTTTTAGPCTCTRCCTPGWPTTSGCWTCTAAASRAHLADYARLFGGDGAPMHQGRSLTYRFATTAPLWLGALDRPYAAAPRARPGGWPPARCSYFLDRGAVDDRGLLTLGWHGPDAAVLQGYSGPASPYWASKGFLGLLLPAGPRGVDGARRSRARPSAPTPSPRRRPQLAAAVHAVPTAWSASTTTAARTSATTRTTRASRTRR